MGPTAPGMPHPTVTFVGWWPAPRPEGMVQLADVTVYWRPMCGYCELLKRSLQRQGIAFDDVDIWNDREQAEVVKSANNGDELVPTVRVGERFLANPSVDEVVDAIRAAA